MGDDPRSKIMLVGESNPYGDDPRMSLFPRPPGSAGHRLCHAVLGMTEREYIKTFCRTNLCIGPWHAKNAARAAADIMVQSRSDALVLLGARVCRAFGVPFSPFRVERAGIDAPIVGILPHPSGRCRIWNVPGSTERARATIANIKTMMGNR